MATLAMMDAAATPDMTLFAMVSSSSGASSDFALDGTCSSGALPARTRVETLRACAGVLAPSALAPETPRRSCDWDDASDDIAQLDCYGMDRPPAD